MSEFMIPSTIQRFSRTFTQAGFSLFIVGGSVRDHLLCQSIEDYDFTTDALPSDVMNLFPHVLPTGLEHGTVTVRFEKQSFEVTTFRTESEYLDGRHPSSVSFTASLEEDLKRRDFTINAFAVDCNVGRIIDLNGGMEDLKNRCIRAIGDPRQRFSEDGLRILRACRFASKLDFFIEDETIVAMSELRHMLLKVSKERIRDEIFKLVQSDYPMRGLMYMHTTRILEIVLPELAKGDTVKQGGNHHQDVLMHSFATCQASVKFSKRLEVRLASLLHDVGKSFVVEEHEIRNTFYNHDLVGAEQTKIILKRLKASNEQIQIVSHLVRNHMFNYQSNWTDSAVRRFINRVGIENLGMLFCLRLSDQMAIWGKADTRVLDELESRIHKIIEDRDALSVKDLAVDGNDLMQAGIQKGKRIGDTLNFLLESVLDDPKQNSKEQLLVLANNYQSVLGFTN